MAASKARLGSDELAFYRDNGFVVPRYRLSEAELGALRAQTEAVIEANPHLENRPIPNPNCRSFRRHGVNTDGSLMEFAVKREIVDIVEQLSGPDLLLWSATIFHKPAAVGKRTPWHRDGEFWPIEPLATTSVWVAVTESTVGNGCLRVIPGSHKAKEIGRHHDAQGDDVIFAREIDDDQFDPSGAHDVELEPGQMVFFDVRMLHGATANTAARPRTGFSARYMPATSLFRHGTARPKDEDDQAFTLETRPLFLVRGRDRAGNDLTRNYDAEDAATFRHWLAA